MAISSISGLSTSPGANASFLKPDCPSSEHRPYRLTDTRIDLIQGWPEGRSGRHRTGVGIGQRDLLVGCVLNRLLHLLQGLHLPAQAGNLLLQPARLVLGDIAFFVVGPV